MNQDIKEAKKRVISAEQREKLLLGRKAAAEKRKVEKTLSKQAEDYQRETLERSKRDKENQRILKEEFARIKQRISDNQVPKKLIKRLDEDENLNLVEQPELEPPKSEPPKSEPPKSEPPKSPKPKIVEKLIQASEGNEKIMSNWNEFNKKKFDDTINNICDNMPNQKTREIFRKAVGAYNIELSLQDNIKNLIHECNQQIYANSEMIQKADQERKRQEVERAKEEQAKKEEAEDAEKQKKAEYEKRLKSFYKMLKK